LLFFQSFFSVFVTHFSLFFSHIFCCFFHTFFISKTCEISVNLPDESQLKSQLKIHHSVPPFSCIIHCFFKHFSLSLSHIFHCFFHAFSVCFSIYFSLTQHMIFQLIYPMKFSPFSCILSHIFCCFFHTFLLFSSHIFCCFFHAFFTVFLTHFSLEFSCIFCCHIISQCCYMILVTSPATLQSVEYHPIMTQFHMLCKKKRLTRNLRYAWASSIRPIAA
jgi:hypothetical protein